MRSNESGVRPTSTPRARAVAATFMCVALTFASPCTRALANPAFELAWEAPPECPSRASFDAAWSLARPELGPSAAPFRVRLTRTADAYEGALELVSSAQPVAPRRVRGTDCAEVVAALVLVATLLVPATEPPQPASLQVPGVALGPGASVQSVSLPVHAERADSAQSTLAEASSAKFAPSDAGPTRPEPQDAPGEMSPRPQSVRLSVALAADLLLAPAPSPLLSPVLSLQLDGQRRLQPWLRLSAAGGTTGQAAGDRADLRFTIANARLEAAPARLRLGSRADISVSVGVEAGLVRAVGAGGDLVNTYRTNAPWVALIQSVRLRVALFHGVSLELAGGVVEPLLRGTYTLANPRAVVHRTPTLAGYVGLGVLYQFGKKTTAPVAIGDRKPGRRPIPL
jgi:hypothetical protein